MENLNWAEIGARIKRLRKQSKLTIERLSEIIDVSPTFIGIVERGDSRMSVENLYKLSKTLSVSVDYLLMGGGSGDCSNSRTNRINAAFADYSEEQLDFAADLVEFVTKRAERLYGRTVHY